MNSANSSEITLTRDSLAGYATANEDVDSDNNDGDNTQYFSILDPEMSFEDMNISLNSQIEHEEAQLIEVTTEEDVGQPFIFSVDGSNEIYGIQVARDEEGNFRKYQIQYTKNANGELVPMLETIQILPLDEDVQTDFVGSECDAPDNEEPSENEEMQVSLKNELVFNQNEYDEQSEQCTTVECQEDDESNQSGTIEREPDRMASICIKQECADLFIENSTSQSTNETPDNCISDQIEIVNHQINFKTETICNTLVQIEENEDEEHSEQFEIENSGELVENLDCGKSNTEERHFEQLFVKENRVQENDQTADAEKSNENDSDSEMFQIVDGVHVTGDVGDEANLDQCEQVASNEIEQLSTTKLLKKTVRKSILKDSAYVDQKIIYVQTIPEKENMETMKIGRATQPNARSLLKCNQLSMPLMALPDPLHLEVAADDKYMQRYSRTKEAKQARQFMNFINSTTISQVPERKERLPRKQQIKPLKHPDEAIVVKEMIVSQNGFIEPISAEEKKYLPVTEYVELIDSGDECSSDPTRKKKKKTKKVPELIEIEISDSEESIVSVTEVNLPAPKSKSSAPKKKRGRPPKNKKKEEVKNFDASFESPPKISRLESDVESVTSGLEVIRVEHEEDVFPEENAISHELETDDSSKRVNDIEYVEDFRPDSDCDESLGQKNSTSSSDVESNNCKLKPKKLFLCKYECEKCKSKFINNFLLSRHECNAKFPFSCDVCNKKYPNATSLNVHKKVHDKGPPVVKKFLSRIPRASKSLGAIPKSVPRP